jgi:hypothetical protein
MNECTPGVDLDRLVNSPLVRQPAGPLTKSVARCRDGRAGYLPLADQRHEFAVPVRCRTALCNRCGPIIATHCLGVLRELFTAGSVWWAVHDPFEGRSDETLDSVRRRVTRRARDRGAHLATFTVREDDGHLRLWVFSNADLSSRKHLEQSSPATFHPTSPEVALILAHGLALVVGRTEKVTASAGPWERVKENPHRRRPGRGEFTAVGPVQGLRTYNATAGRVYRALRDRGITAEMHGMGEDKAASLHVTAAEPTIDLRVEWPDLASGGEDWGGG